MNADLIETLIATVRIKNLNDALSSLEAETTNSLPPQNEYAFALEHANFDAAQKCKRLESSMDAATSEETNLAEIQTLEAKALGALDLRIETWEEHIDMQPKGKARTAAIKKIEQIKDNRLKIAPEKSQEPTHTSIIQQPLHSTQKGTTDLIATHQTLDVLLNQNLNAFAQEATPALLQNKTMKTVLTTAMTHANTNNGILKNKTLNLGKGNINLKAALKAESHALKQTHELISTWEQLLCMAERKDPKNKTLTNLRKNMRKIQEDYNDIATLSLSKSLKTKRPNQTTVHKPANTKPESLAYQQAKWSLQTRPQGRSNIGNVNPSTAPLYKMGDPLDKPKLSRKKNVRVNRKPTLTPG